MSHTWRYMADFNIETIVNSVHMHDIMHCLCVVFFSEFTQVDSGARVAQSLVFCAVLCRPMFDLFLQCIVCFFDFLLPITSLVPSNFSCYLQQKYVIIFHHTLVLKYFRSFFPGSIVACYILSKGTIFCNCERYLWSSIYFLCHIYFWPNICIYLFILEIEGNTCLTIACGIFIINKN